jgi:hypothetical protein
MTLGIILNTFTLGIINNPEMIKSTQEDVHSLNTTPFHLRDPSTPGFWSKSQCSRETKRQETAVLCFGYLKNH